MTGSFTATEGLAPTVRAQANNSIPSVAYAVRTGHMNSNGMGVSEESAHTLDAGDPEAVAYALRMRAGCAGGGKGPLVQTDVSGTLATGNDQTIFCRGTTDEDAVTISDGSSWVIRRLTPVECERLQGFPDNHTLVEFEGKPASDARRYKAIGNSMAVPCMMWIGQRIDATDKEVEDGTLRGPLSKEEFWETRIR